jgi:hypothetical protein
MREKSAVTLDPALLQEAVELTARYYATPRSAVDEDALMDAFAAEFVAESESLEGHDATPTEVLNASRDLALAKLTKQATS